MQKIKGVAVTDSQADVYRVLKRFGARGISDHALVPLAQHDLGVHQSSSGIRTRRKELMDKGLVIDTGNRVQTGSGRQAKVYRTAR